MSKAYWKGVGQKLKKLGKEGLALAAPAAVNIAVVTAVEKACAVIEDNLKKMYKRTGINSAVSFALNLCGILILIFRPFGNTASRYAAWGFFSASFIFFVVRTVFFIKKNGKTTVEVSRHIIRQKSVYKGIEQYVFQSFPLISLAYAGVSVVGEYLPCLKKIPRIPEFVEYLVKIFWKRVALFAGLMAAYTVLVFWVIKPLLLKRFM